MLTDKHVVARSYRAECLWCLDVMDEMSKHLKCQTGSGEMA